MPRKVVHTSIYQTCGTYSAIANHGAQIQKSTQMGQTMAFTANDIEKAFDEFLDESYESYNILNPGDPYDRTGINLSPSSILKNTDPIAYRSYLSDWSDRYGMEETDDEEDLELLDMHRHSDDSDNECEGHESLNGTMGESVYCDGSCKA